MSAARTVRVLVADEHPVVRRGLQQIFATTPDLVLAGEADNGVLLLQRARELSWDVALLELTLPGRNGIDALKMLRKEYPRLPVLIFSQQPEEQYAVRALKAGAAGYLSKHSEADEIVAALRKVAGGKKYVSLAVAEALAEALSGDEERPAHERLSDREFETLRMIAAGRTPAQMAEALNISVKTVSVYRARVLEKMRLHSNAELTHYGIRHGLVE
jgi:two-component system, NarL family, invasion response regulator UvrY